MSRPGQTGEPSMEDILASIRKIVAEEPGTPARPVPDRSAEAFAPPPKNANPLAPAVPAGEARTGGLPLNDLTEALNATFGHAKRPPEDDLDDILDDTPALPKLNGEATRMSLSNRLGDGESEAKSAPVAKPAPAAQNGGGEKPARAAEGPSWSHSRVSFKPAAGDGATSDTSSATPIVEKTVETTSSLGDVRPQSSFPASMSVRSFKAAFPPSPSAPRSEPLKSFRVEPSLRLGDSNEGASNGAMPAIGASKPVISETSAPSFGAGLTRQSPDTPSSAAGPAAAKPELTGPEVSKPETAKTESAKSEPGKSDATASEPGKSAPAKSVPEVIAAMPAAANVGIGAPRTHDDKPAAGKSSPASVNSADPAPAKTSAPEPARKPDLLDRSSSPLHARTGAQPSAPAPKEQQSAAASGNATPMPSAAGGRPAYDDGYEAATAKAAVSALDALAAGLAASGTAGAPSSSATTPPPVAEAVPFNANGALTDRAVALRTEPQPASQAKTMEDTVTELLKPMLREWLAENMPRMVEKALRSEAADDNKRSG